ncbi:Bug family tripartite tricarboxylate transporter substrate binding protein [Ramlibacter sp.]|uniref:Bug family tripartite tricarboxylate transporter substrate binding protein n=1 Tax=Ramlibacter sp. TaxID=1917967 RepID=UPI003D0F3E07
MPQFRRRQILAGALLPLLAPALHAQASFPSKPIHIIVPFPPGGSTDVLARRVGEKIAVALKQPVVVENKPGAGGTLGAAYVAKSPADGHTILMGVTGSNAIGPALYSNLTYDATKDFAPLTMASVSPLLLVVNPKVPAKTLEQFVALAKQKPKSISHGTPGNGTSMHLTAEMFKIATGTDLVHVPYKGSAAVLTDLLGGQIDAMFSDMQVLMQQVKAGKVVPLAVTSAKRHPMLPDVPTMAERGYAGFEALSWQGLFAPAGTPPAVVALLSTEMNKALRSNDIQEYFGPTGLIVEGSTPAEYKEFVDKEIRKWGDIVRRAGVKVE